MDPIDAYLEELGELLRDVPEPTRTELVTEAEDHLRSAVDAAVARGADPSAAAIAAIEQYGDARQIARSLQGSNRRNVQRPLVRVPALVGLATSMATAATWATHAALRALSKAGILSTSCNPLGAIPCPTESAENSSAVALQASWQFALSLVVGAVLFACLWRRRPAPWFDRVPPLLAGCTSATIGTLVAVAIYGASDPAATAPAWLVAAVVSCAALRGRRDPSLEHLPAST